MEKISLLAVDSESSVVPVSFEILERGNVGLRMKVGAEEWRDHMGSNLFKCLLDARVELEEKGFLLCCQGARPDVFPSGMQQQMELGRFASVLGERGEEREVVDIFAPAEASHVVSVERQRVAVYRFFKLPLTGTGEAGESPG